MPIDWDYVPKDEDDLQRCLLDPMWRICSGSLYQIMVKSDAGDGQVIPFKPNDAQIRLLQNLWYRNLILKARQRGFTTLVCILFLDHSLFNPNQRCGIIAQDLDSAGVIFRDKIKLAYDRLPASLLALMPLKKDSASELLFSHNNSSIRVATSMRSGTIHRLLVSELGKICAKFPDRAAEIVTGSFPAVPKDGITIIESTAEGREGEFYTMSKRAQALAESGEKLTERDYRFHFVPWWDDPGYRIEAGHHVLSKKDNEYFDKVEAKLSIKIVLAQRRWYIATRDSDFSGDESKMWQEYPSYPDEAFQVSTEGTYYAVQLAAARKAGRIGIVPHVEGVPVDTYWDIGNSDGTAIWFKQTLGMQDRFIGFLEGWAEPYGYYIRAMQALGYIWGRHHLPHDAEHERQQGETVESPLSMLRKMGVGGQWVTVPRVGDLTHGIQLTRDAFSRAWFDEAGCKEGIIHLEGYRKAWNQTLGAWSSHPIKNVHTEGADAFRQWAQSLTMPAASDALPPLPKLPRRFVT